MTGQIADDDDWRCPGCDKPWEELPVGHCIPVGFIRGSGDLTGQCSDPKPVQPWEFMPTKSRSEHNEH